MNVAIQLLPLIIPSDNIGATFPDYAQEVPYQGKSAEPSATTDTTTLGGRSAVSATVKLLQVVRDSTNGFGPLKSVAGGLCLILENCDVWPPSYRFNTQCLQPFQQTGVDEQAIESLAPRVKALSGSLYAPIPVGDVNEKVREKKLEQ